VFVGLLAAVACSAVGLTVLCGLFSSGSPLTPVEQTELGRLRSDNATLQTNNEQLSKEADELQSKLDEATAPQPGDPALPRLRELNEQLRAKNAALSQETEELRGEFDELLMSAVELKKRLESPPDDATLRRWLALRWAHQNALGEDWKFLRGLKGCRIVVENVRPGSPVTPEEVRETVEFQFRKAGVRVLPRNEAVGCFYVRVNGRLLREGGTKYAANVRAAYLQPVTSLPNLVSGYADAWDQAVLGAWLTKQSVRDMVSEVTDKFLNDFLKANPKD